LTIFVGHWGCAGHFVASGADIRSTIGFLWQDSTHTLHVTHDDLAPAEYHAVELRGPAKTTNDYRSSIGDNYSGIRWLTSIGWVGDSFLWTRSAGIKPVERFTYSRKSETLMTVDGFLRSQTVSLFSGIR
jgi:hypothetical protein